MEPHEQHAAPAAPDRPRGDYADAGAELNAIGDRIRERLLSAGLFTEDTARDLERLAHIAAALTALAHDEGDPQARTWLGLRRLAG